MIIVLIFSTGKAPPNLSQGVPPLLPNQYIMGPGGLLPAYPVSRPFRSRILVYSLHESLIVWWIHLYFPADLRL